MSRGLRRPISIEHVRVVLLAGGLGTRMREETEYRPKPMVDIGGRPVLWHIMKLFSHFGLCDFVVAAGYKSEVIKDYFLNYRARTADFTVDLGSENSISYHGVENHTDWKVTVVDTGPNTQTGGRVKKVEAHVDGPFIVTYGDGLSNVNIGRLLDFHRAHGRLATVTTVKPLSRFGVMDIGPDGEVQRFREKPQTEDYVNAGFFVFEPAVLDRLTDDCVLEQEPLEGLATDQQLMAYRHDGFWQPMDTYREYTMLNEIWDSGSAPWKVWE